MLLSEFKRTLSTLDTLNFQLPDGTIVPEHFHVTEVGKIEKNFIDCGGTVRKETVVNFQLWSSVDIDHRLQAKKLIDIIKLSEDKLDIKDAEIEVEYQSETIGKYGLSFSDGKFLLDTKMTDCLAKDNCGIPEDKPRIRWSNETNSCAPGSGCC